MALMRDLWHESSSPISDLRISSTVSMTKCLRNMSLSVSGIRWFRMLRRVPEITCRPRCQSLQRRRYLPTCGIRNGKSVMQHLPLWALTLLIATAGVAVAQQSIFYPAKGQSQQQQAQDQAACQSWATQQTGATPGAPAAPPPPRAGGRARGAAAGAAGAAITGNDAGKGAAAGAVGGAAAQRGVRRQDRRQASAQQQQADTNFSRAMAACMQGRGYTAQ
jgi:hypothetical protein